MNLQFYLLFIISVFACSRQEAPSDSLITSNESAVNSRIISVNENQLPVGDKTTVIEGVNLIDGTGSNPLANAVAMD